MDVAEKENDAWSALDRLWGWLAWGLIACLAALGCCSAGASLQRDIDPPRCYPNWTCPIGQECIELPTRPHGWVGYCVATQGAAVGATWRRIP